MKLHNYIQTETKEKETEIWPAVIIDDKNVLHSQTYLSNIGDVIKEFKRLKDNTSKASAAEIHFHLIKKRFTVCIREWKTCSKRLKVHTFHGNEQDSSHMQHSVWFKVKTAATPNYRIFSGLNSS